MLHPILINFVEVVIISCLIISQRRCSLDSRSRLRLPCRSRTHSPCSLPVAPVPFGRGQLVVEAALKAAVYAGGHIKTWCMEPMPHW